MHPVSGRQYANVMGVGGASWLERPERDAEENPQAAIEALGLMPGMVVCDLGAGSGYYSIRMAQKVGTQGKVYAVDIQPGMIKLLEKRIKDFGGTLEPALVEMSEMLPLRQEAAAMYASQTDLNFANKEAMFNAMQTYTYSIRPVHTVHLERYWTMS